MYFNEFASSTDAKDLTQSDEFASLLESAAQFKVPFSKPSRYVSRNVVINGVRLHTLEWGDTSLPPVLMLHGGGLSAHTWDFVSLALSDRYHVIAVDQRGHGDSEWPRDWDAGIPTMARDVEEIIGGFGSEKPMVIAHSMSGRVSMSLFSKKDLAKKLVIVDIGPEASRVQNGNLNRELNEDAAAEAAARQRIEQQNWQWDSVDAYVKSITDADASRTPELIKKTMGYNLMQRSDGMVVSKVMTRSTTYAGASVAGGGASMADLAGIKCPTLIVRGERSPTFAEETAQTMLATIPDARFVTVSGAGHNVHSQNTLGFLAEIQPFLAS